MPVAFNPDDGSAVFLDQDGGWKPAQIAKSESGDSVAFDGQTWVPLKLPQKQAPVPSGGEPTNLVDLIKHVPTYYRELRNAGLNRMTGGFDDAKTALIDEPHSTEGALKFAKGVGNTALGATEYALSPVNTALRTVVGRPLEVTAGIPKEYSEFAASLALPLLPKGMPKGAPVAATTPAAAPAAARAAAPTIDGLKTAARAGYTAPEVAAVEIASPSVQKFSQTVRENLNKAGVDENLAPKTFAILGKTDAAPAGAFVTVDNLQSLRRTLGNAAKSPDATERMAARSAINELNDYLAGLSGPDVLKGSPGVAAAILKEANANYSAAMKAAQINEKIVRAELRAASTNSGQNVGNAMRQRIADVLANPKLNRGYSPEELAQMDKIVRGTKVGNLARKIGNTFGGGGGLGALAAGGVGAAAAGWPGMLLAAPGFLGKYIQNASTMRQIAKLDEMIRMNSPLARKGLP